MRSRRGAAVALVAALLASSAAGPAASLTDPSRAAAALGDAIDLPRPVATLPTFEGLGLRPDRRLVSHVPGPVRTRERVEVQVDGAGRPAAVVLDEHLRLTGTGDYLIYERGPARAVEPIGGSVPPVLKLGTVIWQGFSPGGRDLAARLQLDPELESERLPLRVTLSWQSERGGPAAPLEADGRVPGDGTVTVHLENASAVPRALPVGVATAARLARALDTLYRAAQRAAQRPRHSAVLPVAGRGLPVRIPARDVAATTTPVVAPLRVTGTIRAPGTAATLAGPTVRALPDGGRVNGVLASGVDFALPVAAGSRVELDLTVTPALDARLLEPPGARSWAAWARAAPGVAERRAAATRLVTGAAAAARVHELSPYVGADTPGTATTVFRYALADEAVSAAPTPDPEPRPYAITLVGIAALAIVGNAVALWRRL